MNIDNPTRSSYCH